MVVIVDKEKLDTPSDVTRADSVVSDSASTEPNPPPYEPPTSSKVSVEMLPDRQATNYLDIYNAVSTISGKWKIDTKLRTPAPPGKPDPSGRIPNVSLKTNIGTISADLELVGGSERAIIRAQTNLGTLSLRLSNPTAQKVDLHCQTHTGTVNVYLPHTFRGPVTLKSDLGTREFSAELEKSLTMFSQRMGVTKGFIGALEGSGFDPENPSAWEGDQLFVQSSLGTVDLLYLEEHKKRKDKV